MAMETTYLLPDSPEKLRAASDALLRAHGLLVEHGAQRPPTTFYALVCASGATAGVRWHAFAHLRAAALGSLQAGDLSGWEKAATHEARLTALQQAAALALQHASALESSAPTPGAD